MCNVLRVILEFYKLANDTEKDVTKDVCSMVAQMVVDEPTMPDIKPGEYVNTSFKELIFSHRCYSIIPDEPINTYYVFEPVYVFVDTDNVIKMTEDQLRQSGFYVAHKKYYV